MANTAMDAVQVFDREFLDIRCRIIDIAAAMDRVERAADSAAADADPRMTQLQQALAILIDRNPNRAARVQLTFSDEYDPNWRKS